MQQEKPLQWEARTPQLKKSLRSDEDPAQPQICFLKKIFLKAEWYSILKKKMDPVKPVVIKSYIWVQDPSCSWPDRGT